MKTWIKRTLFGLFGATLLVGGLTACGGHGRWCDHAALTPEQVAEYRAKMVDRISGKLDLNEAQKKLLSTLGDKLHEQRLALIGASASPRAELQALVAGDKFERTRAQNLITEKTAALTSQSPAVIAALADFYDSLNPTQQQKVRDLMQQRGGWLHR